MFRNFSSRSYRSLEFIFKLILIKLVRALTLKSNHSIYIRFDSGSAVDGTGAQLQRLISVYALARYFQFNYCHSHIRQISVHALDPFQTKNSYDDYLSTVNDFIEFSYSQIEFNAEKAIELTEFNFFAFLALILKNRFKSENFYISLLNPYSVTEFNPEIMSSVRNELSINSPLNLEPSVIVLHYRQGVGGFAIYPGQKISRETPLLEFQKVLTHIFNKSRASQIKKIIVLTDAPAKPFEYAPPSDQLILWEGTPGYRNGKISIMPIDFQVLSADFSVPVEVIRGGNPLDAIRVMASSDFLIMSKSSLSYLGALLNQRGQVYYSREFWHRPLKNWTVF